MISSRYFLHNSEFLNDLFPGKSAKMREHFAIDHPELEINRIKKVSKLNYGYTTVPINDFGGQAATTTVSDICVKK